MPHLAHAPLPPGPDPCPQPFSMCRRPALGTRVGPAGGLRHSMGHPRQHAAGPGHGTRPGVAHRVHAGPQAGPGVRLPRCGGAEPAWLAGGDRAEPQFLLGAQCGVDDRCAAQQRPEAPDTLDRAHALARPGRAVPHTATRRSPSPGPPALGQWLADGFARLAPCRSGLPGHPGARRVGAHPAAGPGQLGADHLRHRLDTGRLYPGPDLDAGA